MLTEDQIVRFSRQILLRQVGGAGQERLLSTGVRLSGDPTAREIAETYLAAGGSPLDAAGPSLALGWRGERGVAVFRDGSGCAGCFEATAAGLAVEDRGAESVLLGAVGALAAQRLVLGLASGLAAVELADSGDFRPTPVVPCEAHR